MARLHPDPYTFAGSGNTQAEMKELDRLLASMDEMSGDTLVGVVIDFPVADGKAMYLVTEEDPLTLQHLPFWDGYSIPAPYVRGLEREDIIEMANTARRWRQMIAKKQPTSSSSWHSR